MFKGNMEEQGRKLMTTLKVVVNGLTRLEQLVPAVQSLGRRHADYGVQYGSVDFAAASAALGAWSRRVTTLDDLEHAVTEARRLNVPAVIEVPIDPMEYRAHAT